MLVLLLLAALPALADVFLQATAPDYTGVIGARAHADAICALETGRARAKAVLSYEMDHARDLFADDAGPVVGPKAVVAPTWAALFTKGVSDWTFSFRLNNSLFEAGVMGRMDPWWSGSTADGLQRPCNCHDWTGFEPNPKPKPRPRMGVFADSDFSGLEWEIDQSGRVGDSGSGDASWISSLNRHCHKRARILCAYEVAPAKAGCRLDMVDYAAVCEEGLCGAACDEKC